MSVAVIVHEASETPQLIRWALLFARARNTDLSILHPVHRAGESRAAPVPLTTADADEKPSLVVHAVRKCVHELTDVILDQRPDEVETEDAEHLEHPPLVSMTVLYSNHTFSSVLEAVTDGKFSMLVIPRHEPLDANEADHHPGRQWFRRAPCETVILRPGMSDGTTCRRILTPCAQGVHARAALRLARDIALPNNGTIEALYVEPDVGVDAQRVGERILDRVVTRALGADASKVNKIVVVANKVHSGIASTCDERHDLVLLGASKQGAVRRLLFGTVSESLMKQNEGPALAVVRASIPITNQLQQTFEAWLQKLVPQLEREQRVKLVERVQSNSQWDFDFITLMCLSTMIAALGLVQDSAAVVIGAMLVAPLMTPLLGIGLALVQGNQFLVRHAARAVVMGFLLAFGIALLLGLLIGDFDNLTAQMLKRTSPGTLDLMIAFASGLAAAYATSRPSLLAALPGVAIAAALLPPIATAGLATALSQPLAAIGATLLFLTNMVAIAFGASVALWAVGVRSMHQHGRSQTWTAIGAGLLVIATIALAIWLQAGQVVEESRPLPPVLIAAIEKRVQSDQHSDIVSIKPGRAGPPRELVVVVSASEPADLKLANDLAAIARKHYGSQTRIRLVTELVREVESDGNNTNQQ